MPPRYQQFVLATVTCLAITWACGCRATSPILFKQAETPETLVNSFDPASGTAPPQNFAQPTSISSHHTLENAFFARPLTGSDTLPENLIAMSLDEAIRLALQDARTMRSLNAQVLSNPAAVASTEDLSIRSTDPIFGVDAALAQFDANLSASLLHQNNDDVFNNSILGGGATEVVQDLTTADANLTKTYFNGAQLNFNSSIIYDSNNNPLSIFPSSYRSLWEAQARLPLLQGRGTEFNSIAGPNASPGLRTTTGLVIAQINNNISAAQFEQSITQFVDEVVTAYWNLYVAYRNFDTAKTARDGSLETWKVVKARFDNDLEGGEADKEAQAREQYFQFQQQVVTALNGETRSGTQGVLQAEADLRRLIGLPQSDGSIIRPSEQPFAGSIAYDWGSLLQTALLRRVELRQQMSQINRRELELLASKNFLLPEFDAVLTFRNNGFGDQLIGGSGRFSSAANDAVSGDHNEFEAGLFLNMPLGFRLAHAGVRNSELQLVRERQILEEQEKQVAHDLGSALRAIEQSTAANKLAYNRMLAAQDAFKARQAAFEADAVTLDLLLEAVRRMADAQAEFDRTQVNAQLANESILRESGQLLQHHAVGLQISSTVNDACDVAIERREQVIRLREQRKAAMNYRWW